MGRSRADFALAGLFGAHAPGPDFGRKAATRNSLHTYLRLSPELRARIPGPQAGDEPAVAGERHEVLAGFEETDILPFGGVLESMRTDPGVTIPLTYVPPFPVYPPETAWMRQPKTDIAGLVLNTPGKARVAYLAADLDRRYGRDNLPDHGNLLANLFRWAAGNRIPLEVRGAGLIDCHLYRQPGRLILHLVNLSNEGTWRSPGGRADSRGADRSPRETAGGCARPRRSVAGVARQARGRSAGRLGNAGGEVDCRS